MARLNADDDYEGMLHVGHCEIHVHLNIINATTKECDMTVPLTKAEAIELANALYVNARIVDGNGD